MHGLATLELSFDAIGWQRGFRFHALRIVASLQLVAQHKTVRSRIGVTAAACVQNFHVVGGPDIPMKLLQYEVVAAALGARHSSYWPVFQSHRSGSSIIAAEAATELFVNLSIDYSGVMQSRCTSSETQTKAGLFEDINFLIVPFVLPRGWLSTVVWLEG
jgi:hypothetical protein